MTTLTDKVAIITGGRTGIGKATADLFYNEGARVITLGRTPSDSTQSSEYFSCDIRNEREVEELVKKVHSSYGQIDILVNNAGIHLEEGALTDLEEKIIDDILATNVKGTLLMSKHTLRVMQKQRRGNIVNVASILGVIGAEETAAYSASKGAIVAMTRVMAMENAGYGIRVNCISPNLVLTDMISRLLDISLKFRERIERKGLINTTLAPIEVANTILYLASDASSSINGQNIVIDKGRSRYDR